MLSLVRAAAGCRVYTVVRLFSTASAEKTASAVDSAVHRIGGQPVLRPRGWRRHKDFILLGLTTVVAITALRRRRLIDEQVELLKAQLERAETDRDSAVDALQSAQTALRDDAPAVITSLAAANGGGFNAGLLGLRKGNPSAQTESSIQIVRTWVDTVFECNAEGMGARTSTVQNAETLRATSTSVANVEANVAEARQGTTPSLI